MTVQNNNNNSYNYYSELDNSSITEETVHCKKCHEDSGVYYFLSINDSQILQIIPYPKNFATTLIRGNGLRYEEYYNLPCKQFMTKRISSIDCSNQIEISLPQQVAQKIFQFDKLQESVKHLKKEAYDLLSKDKMTGTIPVITTVSKEISHGVSIIYRQYYKARLYTNRYFQWKTGNNSIWVKLCNYNRLATFEKPKPGLELMEDPNKYVEDNMPNIKYDTKKSLMESCNDMGNEWKLKDDELLSQETASKIYELAVDYLKLQETYKWIDENDIVEQHFYESPGVCR